MLFLSEKSRNVVGKDVVVRKRKHLQTCCVKPDKESQAKREIDNVLSTETVSVSFCKLIYLLFFVLS